MQASHSRASNKPRKQKAAQEQISHKSPNGCDQGLAATGLPPPTTMPASPLHRVVPGEGELGVGRPPRDGTILPLLRGCRPHEMARHAGLNQPTAPNRRINPPLEGQRRDASSGWTLNQVPRAHAAVARLNEPTTLQTAPKHFQVLRGHAGDGADCVTRGPLFTPQATEKARNF